MEKYQAFCLSLLPIVFLNITLLAAGFYGFRQFRRFWVVYFVVVWSFFLRDPWVGRSESWLTVLSAKISSFFLWYLGFNSSTQGDFVYVNNGIIEIYNGCTLTPLFFVSIDLLVILYVFYPISRKRRDFVVACLLAFGLAFVLSIVRLAIMALVVNDPVKFEFWHGSQGSNLFMTICLVGCGLFALGRMPEDKSCPDPKPQNPLPALAKPEWAIRGCLLASAIILLFLILQRNGLAKPLANFEFPEKIPLTEWQVKTSRPLSVEEMGFFVELEAEKPISDLEQAVEKAQKEQVGSNILMSGRRYYLEQAGMSSEMTLSYVLNSDVTFPLMENIDINQSTYERLLEKVDFNAPYLIVDGKNKIHLVSCLMNGGQSVVTNYSVLCSNRIRHILSNPETIYQWMNGQRLLQDRRCLWVHLLASSTTPAVDYHLVQIWEDLQKFWQKSYPSL
ncbi:MAG: archaeosortase/exosortase family protein [Cyanobacteriota bacterium]